MRFIEDEFWTQTRLLCVCVYVYVQWRMHWCVERVWPTVIHQVWRLSNLPAGSLLGCCVASLPPGHMQALSGVELLGFGRLEPLIMSCFSSDLRDGFHASLHSTPCLHENWFWFLPTIVGQRNSCLLLWFASGKKQKAGRSEISWCWGCFGGLAASFRGKSLAWQSPWRSHFLRSKPSPPSSAALDPCLVLLQEDDMKLSPHHGHPLNESASPACLGVLHPSNGKG